MDSAIAPHAVAPAHGATAGAAGSTPWPLAELQALPQAAFEAALAHAVEHAPWVARRAWPARPFADSAALVQAMCAVIGAAPHNEQLALLRGHPELAGSEAREGRMTADSTSEQGRLGLDRLDRATWQQIESLNRRYQERFGYPLVIALRLHADLPSVLAQARGRLEHTPADELPQALQQVCEVMRGRIERLVRDEAPCTRPPPTP